jgi:hypothetical protein
VAVVTDLVMIAVVVVVVVVVVTDGTTGAGVATGAATRGLFAQCVHFLVLVFLLPPLDAVNGTCPQNFIKFNALVQAFTVEY